MDPDSAEVDLNITKGETIFLYFVYYLLPILCVTTTNQCYEIFWCISFLQTGSRYSKNEVN